MRVYLLHLWFSQNIVLPIFQKQFSSGGKVKLPMLRGNIFEAALVIAKR